jgi:ATP synthase protein I
MVILLLVGFAAGILNVVRATAEMNAATAVPPGTPAVEDDDDD